MSLIRFVAASCAVMAVMALLASSSLAQEEYQTAEEAWRVGMARLSTRNYAASQAPLEAALRLAPDDKFRFRVYEALIPAYRLLPEPDKFVEASQFLLAKSDSEAKQSLVRRSLLSFMFQRGRIDELAHQYEDALKKNPEDRTALLVLTDMYSQVKRDPAKATDMLQRLVRLDEKQGRPLNVAQSAELARQYVQGDRYVDGATLYEKLAGQDAKMAAWYWKEAAGAWLKAGESKKALAAAKQADAAEPEQRNDQMAHYWHRGLGDVYLATGEPKLAIPHFEKAIEKTTIAGYVTACQESLAKAKAQAGP